MRRGKGRGQIFTVNSPVDPLQDSGSISIHGIHKSISSSSSTSSTSSSSSSKVSFGLVYAGTPHKATAIEAAGQPTSAGTFVAALRLAAVSTKPLIAAQQQLAAAVAAAGGQQQQQQHLPLLWPDARVQQVVAEHAEGPLRALFSQQQQESSGSNVSSVTGSGSGSSDKQSRAAALAGLQSELLRDLQRLGLLAETPAAAAAGGGMLCREDVLRAFDVLQSRVMREVLLNGQVRGAIATGAGESRGGGGGGQGRARVGEGEGGRGHCRGPNAAPGLHTAWAETAKRSRGS